MRTKEAPRTNWDRYYSSPYKTAQFTRKITQRRIVEAMLGFVAPGPPRQAGEGPRIVELGGANSCFLAAVRRALRPRDYHVVDSNELGLRILRRRLGDDPAVVCHRRDILDLDLELEADLAFSVGLIEHFSPAGTRQAVRAHFDLLRPGGIALITFPTPTWLYHSVRRSSELLGKWMFPDERPLPLAEVRAAVIAEGDLLREGIIWQIGLTQGFVVARKAEVAEPVAMAGGAGRSGSASQRMR